MRLEDLAARWIMYGDWRIRRQRTLLLLGAIMLILFVHGWTSAPGGVKPTYLKNNGHHVLNPAIPDDDFADAVRVAQAEFDQHHPEAIVGSSRGGAVAMNINSGTTPLVLLCPAWKRWGTARTIKPGTVILHSPADETIPFADSQELLRNSGLPESALIAVGHEHRLADPDSLQAMLEAVERHKREPTSSSSQLATQGVAHGGGAEKQWPDAAKVAPLLCKKLLEIMDVQSEIDALVHGKLPMPYGSNKWKHASLEELERLVLMTAVQFVLREPVDGVVGNDEFQAAADRLLDVVHAQMEWLEARQPQR